MVGIVVVWPLHEAKQQRLFSCVEPFEPGAAEAELDVPYTLFHIWQNLFEVREGTVAAASFDGNEVERFHFIAVRIYNE